MWLDSLCAIYLGVLSVYHILSGAISFLAPGAALSLYRALYGCNPVERRHVALMLKPWGALAVCAGIAGIFAALDPLRYVGVVWALLSVLVFRIVYRIVCRADLRSISGIPPRRNLLNIALLAGGVAILSTWLWVRGAP